MTHPQHPDANVEYAVQLVAEVLEDLGGVVGAVDSRTLAFHIVEGMRSRPSRFDPSNPDPERPTRKRETPVTAKGVLYRVRAAMGQFGGADSMAWKANFPALAFSVHLMRQAIVIPYRDQDPRYDPAEPPKSAA